MLITLKNILKIAEAENIAIGAFNVTSLEGIRALFKAAEELNRRRPAFRQSGPQSAWVGLTSRSDSGYRMMMTFWPMLTPEWPML